MKRITKIENSKHLYLVEVMSNGKRQNVLIDANTRTQAAKFAKSEGYEVCSMSMEG